MQRFHQNGVLYTKLPMKHVSALPDDGFPVMNVEVGPDLVRPVYCKPKGKGSHRVIVICDCGKHVPFGRMNNHYPTHVHPMPCNCSAEQMGRVGCQCHADAESHFQYSLYLATENIHDEDGSEAYARQCEYDPEALDEMIREDMEGKI